MTDIEINKYVNGLRLRCPKCDASVSIAWIDKAKIDFDHYLPIIGANVRSADVKCAMYDNDVRKLVNACRSGEISTAVLKDELIELSRRPVKIG